MKEEKREKTKENRIEGYVFHISGTSLSDWSGATPKSIDELVKKPSKDITTLFYQVVKTQVELLCQKGETAQAMDALKKYMDQEFEYAAPLNIFKKDAQNSQAPYIGAHSFFGAFRDAAGNLFDIYYKKAGDRGLKASDKHLRECVRIAPNHIFLYRDGKKIMEPDEIEGQQPSPDVKGFAKYEVIRHPFTFDFSLQVIPIGHFKEFLNDRDKVLEALYCSTFNGQGARRSAGYGAWKITKTKMEGWLATQA